ncbi:MAG: hypothetical protein MJ246_01470, partial [Clostridia bacterium]|nr:hypothetical protein [Clostridia bacterium]
SSASSVVSHMPYGAEWDTLMKWLEECGYDVAYDSGAFGNYSNINIEGVKQADQQNILNTGNTSYTEANHIFDLAGNL